MVKNAVIIKGLDKSCNLYIEAKLANASFNNINELLSDRKDLILVDIRKAGPLVDKIRFNFILLIYYIILFLFMNLFIFMLIVFFLEVF